jgi:hypothetical protein
VLSRYWKYFEVTLAIINTPPGVKMAISVNVAALIEGVGTGIVALSGRAW